MYTKWVLTVPLTLFNAYFPVSLNKAIDVMNDGCKMCIGRSSYYTQCRFSLELEKNYWYYQGNNVYKMCIDSSSYFRRCRFSIELEKNYCIIRGTLNTKCVLTVPLTIANADFPLNLNWCYQRNDVYNMCIDRSSYHSQWRFFLDLEKNYRC